MLTVFHREHFFARRRERACAETHGGEKVPPFPAKQRILLALSRRGWYNTMSKICKGDLLFMKLGIGT